MPASSRLAVAQAKKPHFLLYWEGRELRMPYGPLNQTEIGVTNVGAFPPKQVVGDYEETSHTVLSSLIQNNWAGGGQMRESQETDDIDRYFSIARMETRFPKSLTHLPLTRLVAGPNTEGARILGELVVGGAFHTYAVYGSALCRIASGVATDTTHDLAGTVGLAPCPIFRVAGVGKMFIPLGSAGYQTWDGSTLSAAITTIKPLNFIVHSRKIWAIDADGIIWKSLDGSAWTNVLQLDPGPLIKGLVLFTDRYDAPTPHVVTDRMVYALDESVPAIYETELNFAPHPYSGEAFAQWRTDLYVAIGLGIQRYSLTTVNAAGLDRDDGVDPSMAGYVSTLCRGFNDLFAGISATVVPGGDPEEFVLDYQPDVYISSASPRCSVMRLTGGQSWHTVWVAPAPGGEVRDLTVSTEGGGYRLLWTWKGNVYYQNLSVGFDNPRDNPTAEFEAEGELISSWFDMSMAINRFALLMAETRINAMAAGDIIAIDYQIDDDDASDTWRHAADLTETGYRKVRTGSLGTFPGNVELFSGEECGRWRYRIHSTRGSDNTRHTPDLGSIAFAVLKRMQRTESFDLTIDCSSPEFNDGWGLSNEERRKLIKRLVSRSTLVPVNFGHEWRAVRFTIANGPEGTGNDRRGDLTVSVIDPIEVDE